VNNSGKDSQFYELARMRFSRMLGEGGFSYSKERNKRKHETSRGKKIR